MSRLRSFTNVLFGVAKRVLALLEAVRLRIQPRVDRWLEAWKEDPASRDAEFVQDADDFIIQQEPLRARAFWPLPRS